jgi:hypothetical protein
MMPSASAAIAEFTGPLAWRANELRDHEWLFEIDGGVRGELEREVDRLLDGANSDAPVFALAQGVELARLEKTRHLMRRVRDGLQRGRGFALLRGTPVQRWGVQGSTIAYWLMSNLIARPVAQNIAGALLYEVLDTGRKPEPGSGVRPDKTSVEQYFHNDNAYNRCQPDYVGLLCIRAAAQGGRSGVASIRTVHNELRARHPDLLPRLYQDFLFDRQKEHKPGEAEVVSAPIFAEVEGELKMRMGLYPLLNAYKLPGNRLDDLGARALEKLKEVLADASLCHEFSMAAGDVQFVNNLGTCHRRTAFVDDPGSKRHLLRVWLRDSGSPDYDG